MTAAARVMLRPIANPLPLGLLARDVVAGAAMLVPCAAAAPGKLVPALVLARPRASTTSTRLLHSIIRSEPVGEARWPTGSAAARRAPFGPLGVRGARTVCALWSRAPPGTSARASSTRSSPTRA